MKTEDLKAQGLTEEQINFVLGENGKDIKALKDENTTLKSEKSQLENDKTVLEKEKAEKEKALADLQKNSITKEEYDNKIKEIEDNAKKEHEDYVINELLMKEFDNLKVKNTENTRKVVKELLDLSKISRDKEGKSLVGVKEQLEALKKSDPHFFETKIEGNEPNNSSLDNKGDEGKEISMGSNFAKQANEKDSQKVESKFFN